MNNWWNLMIDIQVKQYVDIQRFNHLKAYSFANSFALKATHWKTCKQMR